jgi:hypothetical protein
VEKALQISRMLDFHKKPVPLRPQITARGKQSP